MKHHHRRRFLHLAAGAAALPAVSRVARPQAYPSRPVRVIVGFPLHQRVSCERLIQIERRDHAPAINRCTGQNAVAMSLLRRSNPKRPAAKSFMTQ
jgi:hypothetical protein